MDALLLEAAERMVNYGEWFSKTVEKCMAGDRDEFIENEVNSKLIHRTEPPARKLAGTYDRASVARYFQIMNRNELTEAGGL